MEGSSCQCSVTAVRQATFFERVQEQDMHTLQYQLPSLLITQTSLKATSHVLHITNSYINVPHMDQGMNEDVMHAHTLSPKSHSWEAHYPGLCTRHKNVSLTSNSPRTKLEIIAQKKNTQTEPERSSRFLIFIRELFKRDFYVIETLCDNFFFFACLSVIFNYYFLGSLKIIDNWSRAHFIKSRDAYTECIVYFFYVMFSYAL